METVLLEHCVSCCIKPPLGQLTINAGVSRSAWLVLHRDTFEFPFPRVRVFFMFLVLHLELGSQFPEASRFIMVKAFISEFFTTSKQFGLSSSTFLINGGELLLTVKARQPDILKQNGHDSGSDTFLLTVKLEFLLYCWRCFQSLQDESSFNSSWYGVSLDSIEFTFVQNEHDHMFSYYWDHHPNVSNMFF